MWAPEPTSGEKGAKVMAPLLHTIPLCLFKAIRAEGHPLMPYEVHDIVMTFTLSVRGLDGKTFTMRLRESQVAVEC